MQIVGVDSVIFGVEDLEAARKFCQDYGLSEAGHGAAGADFSTLDGSSVLLRRAGDAGLPPARVTGSTARETIWGVRSKADLEELGAELSSDRQVRRDGAGLLHTTDDEGLAVAFRVTERHAFTAPPKPANVCGLPPQRPVNSRVKFTERAKPRSIGHIVYWSDDPDRSMKFYVDRLKFRITDHVRNKLGVFARAAGSPDHHNLFFIGKPGATTGFHHLECHFGDFQEVIVNGSRISGEGWKTHHGPGRHVLGSNYYWYFATPMGGAFELSADMDQLDDNWLPGDWETLQENRGWTATIAGPVASRI